MRWLRNAVFRSAGIVALHDELAEFAKETTTLEDAARRSDVVGHAAFKAVVLEGLEVGDLVCPASLGAPAACVLVLLVGLVVHKPLARVRRTRSSLVSA